MQSNEFLIGFTQNMRNFLFVALLGIAFVQPVLAAEAITIKADIPYANDSIGNEAIRKECNWTRQLSENIVNLSQGKVVATDADFETSAGKKLAITVTDVHAIGGGGWTGPKWARLAGELSNNGKVIANFDINRRAIATPYSACDTLTNIARALSKDVVKWINNNQNAE